MTENHLDALKRACRAELSPSVSKRIIEGESIWLAGRPALAEEGFISIAQDEDICTIIREQDVLEVRKEGDFYWLESALRQTCSCATSVLPRQGPQSATARHPKRQEPGGKHLSLGRLAILDPSVCRSVPAGYTSIVSTGVAPVTAGGG